MKCAASAVVLASAWSLAAAHGQVNRVIANGITNHGPNIYWAGDTRNAQTAVRAMFQAGGPAYALPRDFTNSSTMACEGAKPAPRTLSVRAGSAVQIFWEGATSELVGVGGLTAYNPWVHAMGPIMDYITPCNGSCTTFDPSNAGWTKIAESGLDTSQTISSTLRARMTAKPEAYYPTSGSGVWAMAKLLQAGSMWNISIPAQLRPGQYILRSELAAIHNPQGSNPTSGPQMCITCVQLNVTGAGTQGLPMGTKAGALYDPKSAFAAYNVYVDKGRTFTVPGPSVWKPATALEPPLPGNTSTKTSSTSSTRSGSSGTSSTTALSFSTITSTTSFSSTTPSVSTFTTPLLPSPSASTLASTAISADRILKHSSRCWRALSRGKASVPPSS